MRIRKCYIENFGKLHEVKYEFSEGLNVINEQNGWGKSTLANFIKAMFFGLDASQKRSIEENERKKYFPWQGGNFGGNLEFEAKGKVYEIERFFGKKEKEDTFKLYDKSTNCESYDFSSNIGEELFQIDKQAYERSTYIPQQKIAIEVNDSLSAKLSNILESENDINSSEQALHKIAEAMKEYKKKGNKGKLSELEEKISHQKREREKAKIDETMIEERTKKIEDLAHQLKLQNERQKENQKKLEAWSEKEKANLKKERYQELCEMVKKDEEGLQSLNQYFQNQIPTEEEIESCEKWTYQLDTLLAQFSECQLEENDKNRMEMLEKKFAGKNLTEEKFERHLKQISEIENLKNHMLLLKEKLETEEKINRIEQENLKHQKNKKRMVIFSMILGIVLGLLVSRFLFVVAILGGIYLAIGFVSKTKSDYPKNTLVVAKLKSELENTKTELEQQQQEFQNFIQAFEKQTEKNYEFLYQLKEEWTELNRLRYLAKTKQAKEKEYQQKMDFLIQELQSSLLSIENLEVTVKDPHIFNMECKHKLSEIKTQKREWDNLLLKTEEDQKAKQKYEQENDLSSLLQSEENDLENKEELQQEKETIAQKITDLIHQKSYEENERNRFINTTSTVDEVEAEIENLEQRFAEVQETYQILEKTQYYLAKAKEQFSSHYLHGMKTGFEKYLKFIHNENLTTNMDVKLNVKIQEYGEKKELNYFSTGYRDLIGICMRFALVEALFEKEPPFILLDDPFVNLDHEKLERAKEIVQTLAKDYQVIYFVCHDSRK